MSPTEQLFLAAERGDLSGAASAVAEGADIHAKRFNRSTPLLVALAQPKPNRELVDFLVASGSDLRTKTGTGWSAVTFASFLRNDSLLGAMLRMGGNPADALPHAIGPLRAALLAVIHPEASLPINDFTGLALGIADWSESRWNAVLDSLDLEAFGPAILSNPRIPRHLARRVSICMGAIALSPSA